MNVEQAADPLSTNWAPRNFPYTLVSTEAEAVKPWPKIRTAQRLSAVRRYSSFRRDELPLLASSLHLTPNFLRPSDPMSHLAGQSSRQVSTTLLVLILSNLVLLLLSALRSLPPPAPGRKPSPLDPLAFLASRLSAALMSYLSAAACVGNHPSLENLLLTWHRPAITLIYIELFYAAPASLLAALRAVMAATRGPALDLLAVSGSLALLARLGPVICAHSEIACRVGVVVSVVEEDCAGMSAIKRARELVQERRLKGFALTVATGIMEQAVLMGLGLERAGDWGLWGLILSGPVVLATKFITYFIYTLFYCECKRGLSLAKHETKLLILDEV